MSEEKEEPTVKVSDRRRFSSEGEPLESEASSGEETPAESTSAEPEESKTPQKEEPAAEPQSSGAATADAQTSGTQTSGVPQTPPVPEASFEMLVISLGMQAQMELMSPQGDEGPPPNLDVARHTIDLLSILKDKTQGNLNFEETRLMDNTLTELRFRSVQRINAINEKAKG